MVCVFHAVSRRAGGERKRLSIGVEIIALPDLVFLDEPTRCAITAGQQRGAGQSFAARCRH